MAVVLPNSWYLNNIIAGIDDLQNVREQLVDVSKWEDLGLALGLKYPTLEKIRHNGSGNVDTCKREMLVAWLKKTDGCLPTWKALVDALRNRTVGHDDIANCIAKKKNV